MTNLLKEKEPFLWTIDCQSSFAQMKQALITAPVLVKAQMTEPFELFTDASLEHVGAVLMQRLDGQLKPVGYFSKKLKPVEQCYSTTDREALAIVLACRRFHHFLWGVPFTIHTDHQPSVSVFKRKTKSPRMSRWVIEMQDYRFKVEYRPGKDNHAFAPQILSESLSIRRCGNMADVFTSVIPHLRPLITPILHHL